MAEDIKDFGNTSDAFLKEKLHFRVLRAHIWERKLVGFSAVFSEHRLNFLRTYTSHTGISVKHSTLGFDSFNGK